MAIERRGREWAEIQAQRLRDKKQPVLLVISDRTETLREEMDLKPLMLGHVPSNVYYGKYGDVFTTRWQRRPDIQENELGQRQLSDSASNPYHQLNPETSHRDFLAKVPINLPVEELILLEISDGLEGAIRQQLHILERYSPEGATEVTQAKAIIERTEELATKYILGGITEEQLFELSEETAALLDNIGLTDPKDPDKVKMRDQLIKATFRDSKSRVNTPAARLRARSAYLAAMRRLMINKFIVVKFDTNLKALLNEREQTRWALQRAAQNLEIVLDEFQKDKPNVDALIKIITAVAYQHLIVPKLKPYLPPTREAAFCLITCEDPQKFEHNCRIIGANPSDPLMHRPSASRFLKNGNPEGARAQVCYSIFLINTILKRHTSIEKPS